MTNETIPNVPRELLERVLYLMDNYIGTTHPEEDEIRAILSAPSPAGVDGLPEFLTSELEAVGQEAVAKAVDDQCSSVPVLQAVYGEAIRKRVVDDAQAIIDGLRGEVGAQRIKTCTALKERNDAHEERDQQTQRIGELEGLLRSCFPALSDGGCAALANRIAATLSTGKEG